MAFLPAVETFAIEDGNTTFYLLVHLRSNLLVLVTDNDKLHALSKSVGNIIQEKHRHKHGQVTYHHCLQITEDKVAAANYGKVYTEHQSAQRDVPILVDAAGNDVYTSCAAAR